VYYSLFITGMMVDTLEKVKTPVAAAPVEFAALMFVGSGSVLVFQCFYDTSGGIVGKI
jgi:hypothetical protein